MLTATRPLPIQISKPVSIFRATCLLNTQSVGDSTRLLQSVSTAMLGVYIPKMSISYKNWLSFQPVRQLTVLHAIAVVWPPRRSIFHLLLGFCSSLWDFLNWWWVQPEKDKIRIINRMVFIVNILQRFQAQLSRILGRGPCRRS